ncbi:MAG: hypothetical protein LBE08_06750 [Bifidobacteriaceae bacterium]|jgi:uncharacterized membrane protein YphA (DoxX/SURF4 family)|nr:hypothetical protein [Bifidobacteriaceae bacterium]
MSIIRVKARALIGAAVIADSVDALRSPTSHEAIAGPLVAKFNEVTGQSITPAQAVKGTAIGAAVGGGLIASSIAPRLGACATLAANVPAVLFGYRFWTIQDDADRRAILRTAFFARLALVGAALLILATPRRAGRSEDKKHSGKRGAGRGKHRKGQPAA